MWVERGKRGEEGETQRRVPSACGASQSYQLEDLVPPFFYSNQPLFSFFLDSINLFDLQNSFFHIRNWVLFCKGTSISILLKVCCFWPAVALLPLLCCCCVTCIPLPCRCTALILCSVVAVLLLFFSLLLPLLLILPFSLSMLCLSWANPPAVAFFLSFSTSPALNWGLGLEPGSGFLFLVFFPHFFGHCSELSLTRPSPMKRKESLMTN